MYLPLPVYFLFVIIPIDNFQETVLTLLIYTSNIRPLHIIFNYYVNIVITQAFNILCPIQGCSVDCHIGRVGYGQN